MLRAAYIAVGFIGAGQVHPEGCGERIILNGPLIVSEILLRVGVGEIELPVTAQQVPGPGVSWFERNAAFDYLQPRGTDAMVSQPEPNGLVGEECAGRQRERQNCRARWNSLKCGGHRAVMSYDYRYFRKAKFKLARRGISR